jgi:hypothetical protein
MELKGAFTKPLYLVRFQREGALKVDTTEGVGFAMCI